MCLYLLATTASFVLPTPVGNNISRLAECVGAPLVGCVLWPYRRRALAMAAVVPFGVLQWTPALATFNTPKQAPASQQDYFTPLVTFLRAHDEPAGRVEIVPTEFHWEVAYAAPSVPLARGWERQLDTADNPLFYADDPLTGPAYHAWLVDNGVRFVALPDVPLDYAGQDEGRLLARGVDGLVPVWSDAHWHVFEVTGSDGIVSGPARLQLLAGSEVAVDAAAPGRVLLRVRYSHNWRVVTGRACVSQGPGSWTSLQVVRPGPVVLALRLVGSGSSDADC